MKITKLLVGLAASMVMVSCGGTPSSSESSVPSSSSEKTESTAQSESTESVTSTSESTKTETNLQPSQLKAVKAKPLPRHRLAMMCPLFQR